MTTLNEQILLVAKARKQAQEAADRFNEARELWKAQNEALFTNVELTKSLKDNAEAVLRELTLAVYREIGEKHPAPGVSIRESEEIIIDEIKALEWAKINSPTMVKVSLNVPLFKKLAKDLKADGVTFKPTVTATIAVDLSKFVKEDI